MSSGCLTKSGERMLAARIPRGLHVVTMVFARARWLSANHTAATLVGANIIKG